MMNLKFKLSLFVALVLCINAVFSHAIPNGNGLERRRSGDNKNIKYMFAQIDDYYYTVKDGNKKEERTLTNCRLDVNKRAIFCDDKKHHHVIEIDLKYNPDCSYKYKPLSYSNGVTPEGHPFFNVFYYNRRTDSYEFSTKRFFEFHFDMKAPDNGCYFHAYMTRIKIHN